MQPTFTTENPVAGQGDRHCLLSWPIRAKKNRTQTIALVLNSCKSLITEIRVILLITNGYFCSLEFFFNTNERRKIMLLIAHYRENVEME